MAAVVARQLFGGRYIHFGVREHGMAAAVNGMALHGGIIPYGGTFLVFTDYMRPAIRLAALMRQRVIHVLTHDCIGLGEDGPTHQPVEHLAEPARHAQPACVPPGAMRWRPPSAGSSRCRRADGPSRAGAVAADRCRRCAPMPAENRCARGGYVLAEAERRRAGPR